MYSSKAMNLENFIVDLAIGSISAAVMGGVTGYVLAKTK